MTLPRTATDSTDPIRELVVNSLDRERQNLRVLQQDRLDAQAELDTADLGIAQTETRISAYEAWLAENP